jgi:geranylgeranyl pyrophosphate synthase
LVVGLAFQVQDDILDIVGDAEKLGKEVNQDARNEKNTYVAEYGINRSKLYVREQSGLAIRLVEEVAKESDARNKMVALIRGMIDRNY